jgi:hypothetical protein
MVNLQGEPVLKSDMKVTADGNCIHGMAKHINGSLWNAYVNVAGEDSYYQWTNSE